LKKIQNSAYTIFRKVFKVQIIVEIEDFWENIDFLSIEIHKKAILVFKGWKFKKTLNIYCFTSTYLLQAFEIAFTAKFINFTYILL